MPLLHALTHRKRNPGLVAALRVLWVLAIAWNELGTFYWHVRRCAWPDGFLDARGPRLSAATLARPAPTHVLLVADPQVLDHRSYPGRAPWLMALSQWMVDLNMRKSWWATGQLRPDAVMFLGDMMDNGRVAMSDAEYVAVVILVQIMNPTVLLTHIPLARFNADACGPHREKGAIRAGTGYGYQNTLSAQASQFLLHSIRPSIIFSGDDHDYCEYDHPLPPSDAIPLAEHASVREVTVKSFSMAMGVRRPGFQLLSLSPTAVPTLSGSSTTAKAGTRTLDDALCLLPDQLGIYLSVYVPLLAISLVSLLVSNALRVRASGGVGATSSVSYSGSRRALTGAHEAQDASSSVLSARKLSALSLPIRRFDDEEDDDEGALPTPAVSVTGKDKRFLHTRVSLCGRSMDVSAFRRLLHYVGCAASTSSSSRRRRGLLGGFADDVLRVAWPPVVLFVAIAWVMFL
ncbi:hypothetical protein EIP86_001350 [Pleurotus ostreatoroseus]|nr:hypothetical protein EIP86_001350 [Pleurotus ostreatoroseus]